MIQVELPVEVTARHIVDGLDEDAEGLDEQPAEDKGEDGPGQDADDPTLEQEREKGRSRSAWQKTCIHAEHDDRVADDHGEDKEEKNGPVLRSRIWSLGFTICFIVPPPLSGQYPLSGLCIPAPVSL
nr:hypothetical protein [uncultured Lachnoclostridium sp.]